MRFTKNSSKAKITNLDLPLIPINKNVITLKISMDNWRMSAMKVMKAFQDLPTPMLYCSNVNSLMFLSISVQNDEQFE